MTTLRSDEIVRDAVLSPDGVYRYALTRSWDDHAPRDVWIMLNPSTADASLDDPTIRRCMGFSRGWGAGGIWVVNLFALRATNPAELLTHTEPTGLHNDTVIDLVMARARDTGGRVIAAWGAHPAAADRAVDLMHRTRRLQCLGVTKAGHPRHPLYVRADTAPVYFTV